MPPELQKLNTAHRSVSETTAYEQHQIRCPRRPGRQPATLLHPDPTPPTYPWRSAMHQGAEGGATLSGRLLLLPLPPAPTSTSSPVDHNRKQTRSTSLGTAWAMKFQPRQTSKLISHDKSSGETHSSAPISKEISSSVGLHLWSWCECASAMQHAGTSKQVL